MNHSTHAPELIALLQSSRAALGDAGVTTITPGRLTRTKGKAEQLTLSVSVALPHDSGFRVLARRGTTLQEVYFTTKLGAAELQKILDGLLGRDVDL
jgi:hypothetical protein